MFSKGYGFGNSSSGGGGLIQTLSNGLTLVGTDGQLGGTLTKSTTINASNFGLTYNNIGALFQSFGGLGASFVAISETTLIQSIQGIGTISMQTGSGVALISQDKITATANAGDVEMFALGGGYQLFADGDSLVTSSALEFRITDVGNGATYFNSPTNLTPNTIPSYKNVTDLIQPTNNKYTETLLSINWILDTGDIYYQDLQHLLNSEDVLISTYNPITKETLIVEEIQRIDSNNIRIKIKGNVDDIRVVVFNNGIGVIQQTSKVVVNNPTTPYNPTIGDVVVWDCTTGNKVVDLPQASLNPSMEVNVKKIDNTSNTLTINQAGIDEIDGTTTPLVLTTQYDSFTLISNGVNWFIL